LELMLKNLTENKKLELLGTVKRILTSGLNKI